MVVTFSDLKEWLSSETRLSWSQNDQGIDIQSPSAAGFSVWIAKDQVEWTVGFGGGWHDHFNTEAEAVHCCTLGCSGQVRLAVSKRGKVSYRWDAQLMNSGQWQTVSTTGLLFFPWWRRKQIEYFQNPVISPA
jgi:hypothetical protein